MPSNRPVERLTDIVRNCDSILEYSAGFDLDSYLAAPQMVRDAVERCFQRISEAACKLGDYLDTLYPDVDWEGTRGVGNILRHQYDEVENPTIWFGIIEDVPKLRQSALDEIIRLDGLHSR
jgi:uncharacterized protein with HEPN domain